MTLRKSLLSSTLMLAGSVTVDAAFRQVRDENNANNRVDTDYRYAGALGATVRKRLEQFAALSNEELKH